MRWGRRRQAEGRASEHRGQAAASLAGALEARGVPREQVQALAQQLGARFAALDEASRAAFAEGAAAASLARGASAATERHGVQELREVERLMQAFSGELSKLDEVLEVLAAYVRRMRTTTPSDETRVLH